MDSTLYSFDEVSCGTETCLVPEWHTHTGAMALSESTMLIWSTHFISNSVSQSPSADGEVNGGGALYISGGSTGGAGEFSCLFVFPAEPPQNESRNESIRV